jgi:hypothetical protein
VSGPENGAGSVSSGGAGDDAAGVNVRESISMFSSGAAAVVVRMSVFMSSSLAECCNNSRIFGV